MKRTRFLCLLLAILSFCLFSCGKKESSLSLCEDGHDLKFHPQIEATCKTDGQVAYSECSRCHRLFDADGNRLSLEDLILPAACKPDGVWQSNEKEHFQSCLVCKNPTLTEKHKFQDGVCTVCGAKKENASCQHKGGSATCLEKAVCEICGKSYGKLGEHDFSLESATDKTLAKPAVCGSAATYYKACSVCGALGSETFFFGEPNPNNHLFDVDLNATDDDLHTLVCSLCGEISVGPHVSDRAGTCVDLAICTLCECPCPAAPHDYSLELIRPEYLASPAAKEAPATYFYACKTCFAAGTKTFPHGATEGS